MTTASTTAIPAEQHLTKNRIAPTTLRTRRTRPTLRLELQKVLQRGGSGAGGGDGKSPGKQGGKGSSKGKGGKANKEDQKGNSVGSKDDQKNVKKVETDGGKEAPADSKRDVRCWYGGDFNVGDGSVVADKEIENPGILLNGISPCQDGEPQED